MSTRLHSLCSIKELNLKLVFEKSVTGLSPYFFLTHCLDVLMMYRYNANMYLCSSNAGERNNTLRGLEARLLDMEVVCQTIYAN